MSRRVGITRALVLAGSAMHLASLTLPFVSFKCGAPQPTFSLACAIPGYVYLAFPLLAPRDHGPLFLLVCFWGLAVLAGGLSAVAGRFRLAGSLASMSVLPAYMTAILVVPPDRRFGPTCAAIGALLVSLGGVMRFGSRAGGAPAEPRGREGSR